MEKLYEIMEELLEIAYEIESISCVLSSLEKVYENKQTYETHQNIVVFKILMDSFSPNLNNIINKIDKYILDSKN